MTEYVSYVREMHHMTERDALARKKMTRLMTQIAFTIRESWTRTWTTSTLASR